MKTKKLIEHFNNQKIDMLSKVIAGRANSGKAVSDGSGCTDIYTDTTDTTQTQQNWQWAYTTSDEPCKALSV